MRVSYGRSSPATPGPVTLPTNDSAPVAVAGMTIWPEYSPSPCPRSAPSPVSPSSTGTSWKPSPDIRALNRRPSSAAGSVIVPVLVCRRSRTFTCSPGRGRGLLSEIEARSAPCQTTVALTSWRLTPGGDLSWIRHWPGSGLRMRSDSTGPASPAAWKVDSFSSPCLGTCVPSGSK